MLKQARRIADKVTALALSGLLACSLAATGISLNAQEAYAESASVEGYVTGAGTRPYAPGLEILGISTVENGKGGGGKLGVLSWDQPKFYILATDYNENPNPYFVNAVTNWQNGNEDAQPTAVQNDDRMSGARDPRAALSAYGVDETDDAVWNLLPDVIAGTEDANGNNVDYMSAEYAGAINEALGVDYTPIGVANNNATMGTIIDSVYGYAEAADQTVAESNGTKHLRYGDAIDIAVNYEKYVRGSRGYILKQLAADGKEIKTVACVTGYDAATNTYTLNEGGVQDGTATQNRYLEACQGIANNLADSIGTTATYEQLQQADLLLIGGQSTGTELEIAEALGDLAAKTFYINGGMSAAGSLYGVVANSTEMAQNCGRIYGCLYPEYVSQADMIAYWYDTFYHIKDQYLGEVIDNAMDGVRNWNVTSGNLLEWSASDVAGYNQASVQAMLDEGCAYIASLGDDAPSVLQLTDHITIPDQPAEPSFSDVATGDWFYNAVEFVAAEGLMSGYAGTDQFGPWNDLTRAETAAVMFNYAKASGESPSAATDRNTTGLSDLDATGWYTEVCNWAVAEGIMGNDPAGFRPNDTITMEELLAVISNVTGADAASADTSVLASYPDGSSVSDWATHVVAWGVSEGLVGNGDTLDPTVDIYRGRVAGILYNAINAGVM